MGGFEPDRVGWLSEFSDVAVEQALESVAPELAGLPITVERGLSFDQPEWASARAVIDGRVYAKLAFSDQTATRIWREARVLSLLGELGLSVPRVVGAQRRPAVVATELVVGGEPLAYSTVAQLNADRTQAVAAELARFLSDLHAESTLALALQQLDGLPRLPHPTLHTSTGTLRARLTQMIDPRQRNMVMGWCDWIDEQIATPGEPVLVHGDFHPYNQLWQLSEARLLAVVDFESCGLAEPEFDFQVLPVFGPGVELLLATVRCYERFSGRKLNLSRLMAFHLLNYLGDALWRTEAGVDLPQPGDTPTAYVNEAARRLDALDLMP